MATQKSFVIKNGLEVNTDLVIADADTNKVGIGLTVPTYTLHVNGGIGATDLRVIGVSTVNNLVINGRITAGSSLGVTGQYLVSTGAGVTWAAIPRIRTVDTQTATAGQTTFNTAYTVGLIDVYVNGVRLPDGEFTANDGATVVLEDACFGGETVEFIVYSPTGVGVGFTGIQGLTILEEGSPVGSALQVTSINFVGASVTAVGTGVGVTVTLSDYVASAGIATYAGTAGIATYAENAGIATYAISSGIATYSNVAGIATYAENAGISTYSDIAGIATYAISSGIATYASTAGVSTNVIGGIASVSYVTAGIVTATDGFISIGNTTPIKIELSGNQLTFSAVGIGSTTFTLF